MNPEEPRPPSSRPSDPASPAPAPPARSSRRRRGNRLWIVLGILVVFGVIGALSARPVWRAIKASRAEGFAREAQALLEEEKWGPAFEKTRSALQLTPSNPTVLRLAARLYARAGLDMAFPYFDSLLATPNATREDKEDYIALALTTGHADLAGTHLRPLLAEAQPTARTFLLAAQLQGALRNVSNAVQYAREAVRLEPSNPTNSLTLGRILLASRQPAEQREARDTLWPLARAAGPFQLPALTAILATPDAPRSEREEILAILDAKSPRSLAEELLRQDTAVSLDPSRRTEIADALIEAHGRTSLDDTIAVASWLNRQQIYARTLDLVLPDIAEKHPALVQVRYDALVGMEDLRGAYDFILKTSLPSHPANPLQLELLRCTTALRLKDSDAANAHFKNLLSLAAREPRLLRTVADFALRSGNKQIANEAAQRLVRSPRDAAAAYTTLLRIADSQGETWAARDYARKLTQLPGSRPDDSLQLQIAYYDLLLDENVDAAMAVAKAMHEAAPEDFSRRVVLGLAHLRKKEPGNAVELIDHQFVTWNKLPAGMRAVTIAILGANGRENTSAKLIGRVPIASLKPEERDLIRPYATGSPTPFTEDDAGPASDAGPERL